MTSKEDISEELKRHRVKRNCHHLKKIISSINDSMNLFMLIIEKEYLFNIANGKRCNGQTFNHRLDHWFQHTKKVYQRLK